MFHTLKKIRPTLSHENAVLRPFSNSRLEDVTQCPTWGVVHAQKQYQERGRAMALEAGETMHQVFAALRCWQLDHVQKLPRHSLAAGNRIFGGDKWRAIRRQVPKSHSEREQIIDLAITVLHTSGYHDDPDDKVRTIANMEQAAMVYIDETLPFFENWPIWVADKRDPSKPVGIEQVFDVVLEYSDGKHIRYIGTLDGIIHNVPKANRITLAENKTGARLDKAFVESFKMRHQLTGYMACGMALFGIEMWHARVYGLKIKPTYKGEDIVLEAVDREPPSVLHWGNWVRECVDKYEMYEKHYEYAPRYTHSCNRYFRPCSLIPFCADSPQGRIEQWDQMVPSDQSPSERAITGD